VASLTELRQQIELLATGLIVGELTCDGEGPGSLASVAASLEAIAASAHQSGLEELASLAAALLREVSGCRRPEGLAVLSAGLQAGVTRLQEACGENTSRPESSSLSEDPELLRDFVLEAREHLATIEGQSLALERDPFAAEVLNSVFRSFHTIKGLAGFLELAEVQKMAHEVEALLDRARNRQLQLTPAAIDIVLESADYLRRWLDHLESVLSGAGGAQPAPDEPLLRRIQAAANVPASGGDLQIIAPVAEASPGPAEASEPQIGTEADGGGSRSSRNRGTETTAVKVDTAKLDYLVDMAGEMVIAQSLVHHDPDLGVLKIPRLQRNLAQLARITAELQKTAMAMRLVPIGPLFRRMARLVRDLSRQFGKPVDLETEGDDIELDRTIVEELADPLMHMVRNALDHGIETPVVRAAAGKAATARLGLRAYHQAGHVVIEIADDGRGLDREKILSRALERGMIESGEHLADSEVFNLIFEPGFSTAGEVTSVSGRGVGMDVVRRHIQKLRGRIEIRSVSGRGCEFLLKLPLTLAIIDGLVVGVGTERYIVPLFAVREMFRPVEDVVWHVPRHGEVALVRGKLLPVIRLYRRFRVVPRSEDPRQSILLVAETEGCRFCLMVDELIGKQEVVIKTLGETFKQVSGIAGGAILGDGRVGLILDLEGIFGERRDANR
jgi:two-component system chemotaxis sensor kinase CheA